MEPLSIAATAAGLCKVSYEITRNLYNFADRTLNADDHLNAFASEVANISRILKAVTSTLNDPRLRLNQISKGTTANQDVWAALLGAVNNLGLYFNKLRTKLDGINAKGANDNLFKQAIRAFELSLAQDSVDNIRSHLVAHQLSLNTAFQMVQLYAHVNLPTAEQPDLRPEIARLIRMVEKLPRSASASQQDLRRANGSSEDMRADTGDVTRLKKTAMRIASEASVYAESTTGSEYGAPMDVSRAGRIENWLTLSNVPEAPESLSGFSDAATSHGRFHGGISSNETVVDMDGFHPRDLDIPMQSAILNNNSKTAMTPHFSSFSNSDAPKTTAIQVLDMPNSTGLGMEPSSHFIDPYLPTKTSTSRSLKISTQLHYVVRFLLLVQFSLCLTELGLLHFYFSIDDFPHNELLTVLVACISAAYILARMSVALIRSRTVRVRYFRRIFWWHMVPEFVFFVLWVSVFADELDRWVPWLKAEWYYQYWQDPITAIWISPAIAVLFLVTFAIDLALWKRDKKLHPQGEVQEVRAMQS